MSGQYGDACVAVGVAVLDALANGAIAVTVMSDGSGGYLVETHGGEEAAE